MEKNKVWIWRAVCRVSRHPLGWHLGDRPDASLKVLIDQVDHGHCQFVTDEWEGFFRLLPCNRHWFGKDLSYVIEQTNSDIRHRVARFKRKTKASRRYKEMLDHSLKLFHFFQDHPQNVFKIINPFLTFFG